MPRNLLKKIEGCGYAQKKCQCRKRIHDVDSMWNWDAAVKFRRMGGQGNGNKEKKAFWGQIDLVSAFRIKKAW